ncbi:hypothetical protein [Lysobacter sp. GCM10012299]|uniref:hypothetical protein n=1 Tax=Lysobacter sp. GCM10012299 TaxID=3317333 RepID=UPI00360BD68D
MSAVMKPEAELFPRTWFLCTDSQGYETIKHSPEAVDRFVKHWTETFPKGLPITVRELREVAP